MSQKDGTVTVAQNVLIRLISLAVSEVPGVAQLGTVPGMRSRLRVAGSHGVAVRVGSEGVSADCYLVARMGTNLLELGIAVQATVATVLQDLADLMVREVNVYIQDVEAGSG